MPAFSLVFNKLQVDIPTKKLSLSVESSVSLQCPCKSTQHMKTKHLLELLCSGNVWVTHGNSCRIDFVILLDSQLDDEPGMEKIIDNVAAYIQETLLWSQVSLNAELETLERDTSNNLQSNFSIILRQAPPKDVSARPNISLSSVPPDVQVPMSVKCFQLRRIKIVMTFSSGRAYHKTGPLLLHMDSFDQPVLDLYPYALLCQGHEMLDDDDTLLHDMDIDIPLLTTHKLIKNLSALPSPPDSQEEDMLDAQSDCVVSSIVSHLSCTKEMAHLALIKLIGGRQSKIQIGIKVVLRRPRLTLSKLAPNLFSPGFAEAVSQRSRFIPTISHTLSVSLLRNAQSPSLRRKLHSLASNHIRQLPANVAIDQINDMDDQFDQAGNQPSRTVDHCIKRRLWAIMQCSLNNSFSVRHPPSPEDVNTSMDGVKAVAMDGNLTEGPGEAESVMKEAVSSTDHGVSFLEDNFEDLFENLQDEREYDGLETLIKNMTNERIVEDDFEDLFEGKSTVGHDEVACTRPAGCDDDFDIITDHSVRY